MLLQSTGPGHDSFMQARIFASWSGGNSFRAAAISSEQCFLGCVMVVWALYTGRHTYAKLTRSLRGVKGSLRGGVLFIFVWGCLRGWWRESYFVSQFEEVSFEATFAWPFVASFPCILAFCSFSSFHFGLLWLHFLSFWPFVPSTVFGLHC